MKSHERTPGRVVGMRSKADESGVLRKIAVGKWFSIPSGCSG